MFTLRLSKRSLLLAGFAVAFLAACPDPDERFDEFVERSSVGKGGAGGTTGQVEDLTGRFFLALATNLDLSNPLFFDTEVTMTLGPGGSCPAGACKLNMRIQPLANPRNPLKKVDGCPADFAPVGDVIVAENVEVGEDGSFRAAFTNASVPGCANPITGREIFAPSLALVAGTRSVDLFCGMVEGRATKPISLDLVGSTFAAERLAAGEEPADVQKPIFRCPASTGTGGTGGEGGTGGTGGTGGAAGGEAGTGGAAGDGTGGTGGA